MGTAAVVARRRARRAALRGALAIGGSAISSGVLKRLLPRSSMPSAHAAWAAALAGGVAMELPAAAAPLGALAAAIAWFDIDNGAHSPGDVFVGGVIGTAAAAATAKVWPRVDPSPASARPVSPSVARLAGEPLADGAGLTIVVNPSARSGRSGDPSDELHAAFPAARIVAIEATDDLERALNDAAADARAIGVVGGDGSINTAVKVALEHGRPLVVVPGGTLNHFARDLGLDSLEDSARAVREGRLVGVDVGCIDGHPFVNTASLGSYSQLVEAREHLEESIGKWPALIVALVRVLRECDPLEITVDGRTRRIWMIFVGNCAYDPPGFAPATRARLDDGLFDVRIVDGSEPWARARLVIAALTGNLARSKVYSRHLLSAAKMTTPPGSHLLAVDGETVPGNAAFSVEKHPSQLLIYAPD